MPVQYSPQERRWLALRLGFDVAVWPTVTTEELHGRVAADTSVMMPVRYSPQGRRWLAMRLGYVAGWPTVTVELHGHVVADASVMTEGLRVRVAIGVSVTTVEHYLHARIRARTDTIIARKCGWFVGCHGFYTSKLVQK